MTPTTDASLQQRSLDGIIIIIGKNIKLSVQNALRLLSYTAKSADGASPSVTPIVSLPLRWRKGDKSTNHTIVDGANAIELITDTSATLQRGRKLKVPRTIQSANKNEDDDKLPSVHRTSDAAKLSAGSIGNWPQSVPPSGGLYLASHNTQMYQNLDCGHQVRPTTDFLGWHRIHPHEIVRLRKGELMIVVIPVDI